MNSEVIDSKSGVSGVSGVPLYSQRFRVTPLMFFYGVIGVTTLLSVSKSSEFDTTDTGKSRKWCQLEPLVPLNDTGDTNDTGKETSKLKNQKISI